MTRRFYTTCPGCHTRLRMIADGGENQADRYYVCRRCKRGWTFQIDRNFLQRGIPEEFVAAAESLLN